jgi:hypothetical protein
MDRPLRLRLRAGFKREMSERLLILRQVLTKHIPQCFGLLRTQVDPLESVDCNLVRRILMRCSEAQAKIPYAYLHLNAVRVALAIVGRLFEFHFGLRCVLAHGAYRLEHFSRRGSPEIESIHKHGLLTYCT